MAWSYGSKLSGGGTIGVIGGEGIAGRVALWDGVNILGSDAGLTFTGTGAGFTLTPSANFVGNLGDSSFLGGAADRAWATVYSKSLYALNGTASGIYFGSNVPSAGLKWPSAGIVQVTSGGSNLGTLLAGSLTATALATPVITSPLTIIGTPGATTYGYKLTALLGDGTTTAASPEVTIATGNATLDGTNSVKVDWAAVPNAASYKLYRTTGGAAPPKLIYAGALLTFTDIGAAGTGETPATANTTGRVSVGDSWGLNFASQPTMGIRRNGANDLVIESGNGNIQLQNGTTYFSTGAATATTSGTIALYDTILSRGGAAATLQLGAANSATPVAQTLRSQGATGTDIAGSGLTIQSGQGTGTGTRSLITFQSPEPVGSGTGAQTMTTRLQIGANVYFSTGAIPNVSDGYSIGSASAQWKDAAISRSIQGSKTTAIADASATSFSTFTIADGATYTGEIIYNIKAVKATALHVLAGRARFVAARVGTNYYVSISEVGTQTTAVSDAGTLTGAIEISGTGGVITLKANFNTSLASPDSMAINYRFDSPDAALAITSL